MQLSIESSLGLMGQELHSVMELLHLFTVWSVQRPRECWGEDRADTCLEIPAQWSWAAHWELLCIIYRLSLWHSSPCLICPQFSASMLTHKIFPCHFSVSWRQNVTWAGKLFSQPHNQSVVLQLLEKNRWMREICSLQLCGWRGGGGGDLLTPGTLAQLRDIPCLTLD